MQHVIVEPTWHYDNVVDKSADETAATDHVQQHWTTTTGRNISISKNVCVLPAVLIILSLLLSKWNVVL